MIRRLSPLIALLVFTTAAFSGKLFQTKLTKDQQAIHAVDRLTFGPRPGDVERVKQMGVSRWIEEQLHPERIAENPLLAPKLAGLKSMQLSAPELMKTYPPQQVINQYAQGNLPLPQGDPLLRHAIERQVERYRVKKSEGKQAAESTPEPKPDAGSVDAAAWKILSPAEARALRNGTLEERRALLAGLPDEKLDQLLLALSPAQRRSLAAAGSTAVRRKLLILNAPQQVIAYDLNEWKLQRAIYSHRQLEELMVDFWYNHFNVYLDKGADRHLAPSYERDAIRPHAMGRFPDLLRATAHHPAMLFYLDNWQSVGPEVDKRAMRGMNAKAKKNSRGLNENYARELLELHTLGVDGGYTQKDVTEVARCLTGWSIADPRRGAEFVYNDRMHDKGEKTVLGVRIPAGGEKSDGDRVLEIVARHPSTAKFIARKLAMRFVADDPPKELVDRMARSFRDSDGDIRSVLRTMFLSKEFMSTDAYRAKVKSPFEMAVSAARALNSDVESSAAIAQQISQLGQPLYRKVEPTGYSTANAEWVNSAALLGRMNFALSLAKGKLAGVKPSLPGSTQEELERSLTPGGLSQATRATLKKALREKEAKPEFIAGLLLGSPEFQRR